MILRMRLMQELWCLNPENLWLNKEDGTLHITDLEKPNNEGFGAKARWKTAVLNNGATTEEERAWKWNHNRECGYEEVRTGILEQLHDSQDMQQRWDRIKEERLGNRN